MPHHLHTQLDAMVQIDLRTVSLKNNFLQTFIMHKTRQPPSKHLVIRWVILLWYMNINIHGYMEPSLYHATLLNMLTHYLRVHSGSVVECLTRDRRAAGLSLTGVELCP